MKQENTNQVYSLSQTLKQLNEISTKLEQHPSKADKLLREYSSLYIQNHNKSDQYFIALCQNRFLALLFENSANVEQPTCILQCLNLLITNTKYSQELVYFLSQNVLHQHLFSSNVLKRDGEYIQYYIQLLKTILLKISEGEDNKSLIRMFCNNKYPTFPLFTYATILACDPNQLIRVTAQQCILILVGLINQKKIYQLYLSQPPMLLFVVRLATQFLKPDTDHDGICKYLADLMFELKNNRLSLLLISNILCNVIIVSSLPQQTTIALSFVQLFTKSIQTRVLEHKGLHSQVHKDKQTYFVKKQSKPRLSQILGESSCDNLVLICATYYRVIIKYMTNKYLNACYLSAVIQFCPGLFTVSENQVLLPLKVTYPGSLALYKMMQDIGFKRFFDQEHPASQIQLGNDFLDDIQNLISEFSVSKQFLKSKENYLKKIGNSGSKSSGSNLGFFGRIFNRGTAQQLNTQYMKYASDFSSLNLNKGEPITFNVSRLFNASACPFFSEFILLSFQLKKGLKYDNIKTGQQSDSVQANEIHFNDVRSLWSFSHTNLDIISYMAHRFVQFLNVETNETITLVVPKLYIPPCYLFLGQFKDYLSISIQDHINREPKNAELMRSNTMLKVLSRVCIELNVQLSQTSYSVLRGELSILHQQLQTCLFQNGFNEVVDYVKTNNKQVLRELQQKMKMKNEQNSRIVRKTGQQKKSNGIKLKQKPGQTYTKISNFESVQKIMDPHMKPLFRYFETKWKQSFSNKPTFFQQHYEQTLANFKVCYFGKTGCDLIFVKIFNPPTFVLRVELAGKKLLEADITELQGIKKNTIDNRVLQFGGGNVENVKVQVVEMGDQIIDKFKQCKFSYDECVTNATLEYLTSTNETLSIKQKSIMRQSSWRTSASFETPS